MHVVGLNLQGNEVSLHPLYHVVVGSLEHQFKVVLISNLCELIFCTHYVISLLIKCILYLILLLALLL